MNIIESSNASVGRLDRHQGARRLDPGTFSMVVDEADHQLGRWQVAAPDSIRLEVHAFQACSFNHSDISPIFRIDDLRAVVTD